jgi:DNA-directed RNA polymerase specialized sigma24 family protein
MPRTRPAPAFTGDALVVDIHRQIRALAIERVPSDVADDIAQDVVLECLIKIRAGRWSVRHADLTHVLGGVVHEPVLDWLRCRELGDEGNLEHGRDLEDSGHAWMSPELECEERERSAVDERTLEELPSACRRAYLMVREEGQYESAAQRFGVSRSAPSANVVRARRRFRRVLLDKSVCR